VNKLYKHSTVLITPYSHSVKDNCNYLLGVVHCIMLLVTTLCSLE